MQCNVISFGKNLHMSFDPVSDAYAYRIIIVERDIFRFQEKNLNLNRDSNLGSPDH